MKNLMFCVAALAVAGISVHTMNSAPELSSIETDQIYGAGSNCQDTDTADGCIAPCAVQSTYTFERRGPGKPGDTTQCIYTTYPPGEDPIQNNCGSYTAAIYCG